uniref:FHA domain-containing protein n=1 Tax=Haemonchus contortus TaxID=6289 RepID=A0A7I4Y900_HAECO|nr:Forkhead-associated domain containing protein [Haemonchus contortus]
MMQGVRVLDISGKVLYTFGSVGENVFIGRDKKKCGIVLPINAEGVSRVHGSLEWVTENELGFSDSSTYGTVVNGTLLKNKTGVVHDGAHIFVGDVELIISFPQQQSGSETNLGNRVLTSKQRTAAKRKNVPCDGLEKESKRSKLNPNVSRATPKQSQISSFFVKKPVVIDSDDDCAIIAEDTVHSRAADSLGKVKGNMISFVSDSVGSPPDSAINRLGRNSGSISSSSTQMPSNGIARRKKQCIFDVNKRPSTSRTSIVLAEDTQPETVSTGTIEFLPKEETRTLNNITTCIPDTSDGVELSGNLQRCGDAAILGDKDTAATITAKLSAPKGLKNSNGSPADSAGCQLRQKLNNMTSSVNQLTSKGAVRRKKQCIFGVNGRPTAPPTSVVLAEDTQLGTVSRSKEFLAKNASKTLNNVTTCIPDTCDQKARLGDSQILKTVSNWNSNDTVAKDGTSLFAPKISASSMQVKHSVAAAAEDFSDDEIVVPLEEPDVDARASRSSQHNLKNQPSTVATAKTFKVNHTLATSQKTSKRSSGKKTSIFDTVAPKKQHLKKIVDSVSDDDEIAVIEEVEKTATLRSSSSFIPKISASPIHACRPTESNTSSSLSNKTERRAPGKKASIFEQLPDRKPQSSSKIMESIANEEMDESFEQPDLKNILKLVSSGKRYDNGDDDADTEDTKGLEIERVVAKLSELVHYADIERPPKPAVVKPLIPEVSSSKSTNFKRFKKASQGRFNSTLSSASISCVIGGSEDLVDFRQLPQVA